MAEAVETLAEYSRTMHAYNHAMSVLYLDAGTVAPKNTTAGRNVTMEVLSRVTFGMSTDPKRGELIAYLEDHADELDASTRRQVEVARKSYDQMSRIPAEEYVAYSVLLNEAQDVWERQRTRAILPCLRPIWRKSWTLTASSPVTTIPTCCPMTLC